MTKVYLVRHGQTWFNVFNKMQGWGDSPLTEKGLADATKAGERLAAVHFTHAYSSPTTRAQLTAETILAANANDTPSLVTTPFFREQFYGSFEGTNQDASWYATGAPHQAPTYEAIITQYGIDATKNFMHDADPFHAAEDAATYWARIGQGFALLRHDCGPADNVLVVTHGNTIRSIATRYPKAKGVTVTGGAANGSITTLALTPTSLTVTAYNQLD